MVKPEGEIGATGTERRPEDFEEVERDRKGSPAWPVRGPSARPSARGRVPSCASDSAACDPPPTESSTSRCRPRPPRPLHPWSSARRRRRWPGPVEARRACLPSRRWKGRPRSLRTLSFLIFAVCEARRASCVGDPPWPHPRHRCCLMWTHGGDEAARPPKGGVL